MTNEVINTKDNKKIRPNINLMAEGDFSYCTKLHKSPKLSEFTLLALLAKTVTEKNNQFNMSNVVCGRGE